MDGKNKWLIEYFHWDYLLDEIELNKKKGIEVADDWRVAKKTLNGKIIESGSPYSNRYMYSPSLDKLREQTEGEWYHYSSVSDTFAKGGNVWDEDLNVYTLVSSKEYFGSDTASDKRRWFRRNGRGLTRDQAKRMAQDYIDRYGKERVYIGNIRHYR